MAGEYIEIGKSSFDGPKDDLGSKDAFKIDTKTATQTELSKLKIQILDKNGIGKAMQEYIKSEILSKEILSKDDIENLKSFIKANIAYGELDRNSIEMCNDFIYYLNNLPKSLVIPDKILSDPKIKVIMYKVDTLGGESLTIEEARFVNGKIKQEEARAYLNMNISLEEFRTILKTFIKEKKKWGKNRQRQRSINMYIEKFNNFTGL